MPFLKGDQPSQFAQDWGFFSTAGLSVPKQESPRQTRMSWSLYLLSSWAAFSDCFLPVESWRPKDIFTSWKMSLLNQPMVLWARYSKLCWFFVFDSRQLFVTKIIFTIFLRYPIYLLAITLIYQASVGPLCPAVGEKKSIRHLFNPFNDF